MAGITLAQAEAKLSTWMDAMDKIAEGQEYTITTGTTSRTLQRADLRWVQQQVSWWDQQVKKLSRGGIKVRNVVPDG